MTPRPLILDVFCGAGGAAVGYERAGFDVVGVDHERQPRYPFPFLQADALGVLADLAAGRAAGPFLPTGRRYTLHDFATIHASPPCQAYSSVSGRARRGRRKECPDLLAPVRAALVGLGKPYIIENVAGAPLCHPVMLCGSAFGLDVRRHRYFESSACFFVPACAHGRQAPRFRSLDRRQKTPACVVGVHGHLSYPGELALRRKAMGIEWMTNRELTQAVPPAYTHYLGSQLLRALEKGVSGDGGRVDGGGQPAGNARLAD